MNASQLKKYFDPDVERANIAQPQDLQAQNQQPVDTQDTVDTHEHNQNTLQENLNTDGGEPQTQNTMDETNDDAQEYPNDICRLLKYRHKDQYFYIEWTDGS